jgi:TPP-dependent pyruvate/acetoin dehydrogenase alpha subunit
LAISKKKLKEMYLKMMQTRKFEEKAAQLFTLGQVHGTAHFCMGEEATGVGATCALKKEDLIYATHRGHGQSIGKGMDINRMMAEFLGKETGYCGGKGGCMHIAGLDVGNLGANGIVGGGIPIAVGAALTTKMKALDRVVLCFMGDAATNQGTFHESLNLASIWKLPIIFFCVNNQYGMSMSVERHVNIRDLSVRANAYGIKGERIDGNNIIEVYETTLKGQTTRHEKGAHPGGGGNLSHHGALQERCHPLSNPGGSGKWKKKCPIKHMRNYLIKNKIFTAEALDAWINGPPKILRRPPVLLRTAPTRPPIPLWNMYMPEGRKGS